MDILSDILSQLKLQGTLYFRTSFSPPWGVKVPPYENVSRFHLAYRGHCIIQIDSEETPILLEQGDLIIITKGAAHTIASDKPNALSAIELEEVIKKSGFTGTETLIYGKSESEAKTQLICGHFALNKEAKHPLIDNLPPYIHIKNYGQNGVDWMDSTMKIISNEIGKNDLGCELITLKISEIIYTQALRTYLGSPKAKKDQLSGFCDPTISQVLKTIHDKPEYNWTLAKLASTAGISRTLLANKFKELLTITPFNYITNWRMELARESLLSSRLAIIDIAEHVGYQSEAAFGRVFKRHYNITPVAYRKSKKKPIEPSLP